MKLIIDIPTDHYNEIVFQDVDKLRACVKNGTVIENVADVDCVSRQVILERFKYSGNVFEFVNNLPSVAPQPKIGRWLAKSFHEVYCDNCGFDFDIMKNDFIDEMKYYPNCGVKMEGDND